MKKSVCLMAILGALGATSAFAAQSVVVDFAGEVREKACNVTLIDGSTKLDLGHLKTSASADDKGEAIPVLFKLSGCGLGAKGKVPTIALYQNLGVSANAVTNTSIKDGTLGTENAKVVVQFGNDKKADGLPTQNVVINPGNGDDYTIQYGYAYLKAKQASPDAGKVAAKALFTVTYN